jgi:hypothetical protein
MAVPVADAGKAKVWTKPARFVLHEFREILPPTLFFFVGFNLVLLTKRLQLEQYLIQYSGFLIATTGALIVGKAVLVADAMPFLKRFDRRPLAYPILFKTAVYTFFVFVARLIEQFVDYLVSRGVLGHGAFAQHVFDTFSWPRFTATQMWISVLFLLYVTASEVNKLLGDGELYKIFFERSSTELQSTRRRRIRLLTRLSRLTAAHPVEVLTDRQSRPHAELAAILRDLAQQPRPTSGGV